jgi:hypothetical protein
MYPTIHEKFDPIPEYTGRSRGTNADCRLVRFIRYMIIGNNFDVTNAAFYSLKLNFITLRRHKDDIEPFIRVNGLSTISDSV